MVCVPRVLRLSVLYSLKRKKEFIVFRLKAIGQRGENPGKMQKGVDFNGRRRAQISFRLIFPRKRNWHASYFFKGWLRVNWMSIARTQGWISSGSGNSLSFLLKALVSERPRWASSLFLLLFRGKKSNLGGCGIVDHFCSCWRPTRC